MENWILLCIHSLVKLISVKGVVQLLLGFFVYFLSYCYSNLNNKKKKKNNHLATPTLTLPAVFCLHTALRSARDHRSQLVAAVVMCHILDITAPSCKVKDMAVWSDWESHQPERSPCLIYMNIHYFYPLCENLS